MKEVCIETPHDIKVCLVGASMPLAPEGAVQDPRRLSVLAVKTSVGKAHSKGHQYYITAPWKDGWSDWLRQAVDGFPSVLEHMVFTFYIDGCSRVCSHQMVRHRLVSFTQESQRYTEERILGALMARRTWWERAEEFERMMRRKMGIEGPPGVWDVAERMLHMVINAPDSVPFAEIPNEIAVIPHGLRGDLAYFAVLTGLHAYAICRSSGQRMEDCRMLLPQSVRTALLATANAREWLHVIEMRASPKAQWEIREVAAAAKAILSKEVPELFSRDLRH